MAQHSLSKPAPDAPESNLPAVFEIGFSGGISTYQGDLSSPTRGSFKDAAPLGNAFLRYHFTSGLRARLALSGGVLKGDDAQWTEPEYRQHRAFKFTAALLEIALLAEYDFLKPIALKHPNFHLGLYAFGGVGIAYTHVNRDFSRFDASYFGTGDPATKWQQDRDAPAGNTALVLPLGFGVSYRVNPSITAFVEAGYRFSFTDKLDGFSYAVASSDQDGYTLYKLGVAIGLPRLSKRFSSDSPSDY